MDLVILGHPCIQNQRMGGGMNLLILKTFLFLDALMADAAVVFACTR